jgi:site-specific recombinase XerD
MSYGNISFFVWQGLNFLVFGIWSNKLFFKEAIMKNEHTQAINAITAEMEDILKFGKRAENTISTYKTYAVPYLEYCFDTLGKSPCESSEKDVRSFLSCIQADRDLDDRTINNAISSIHFLFVSVLNLPWNKYKVPFLTFDEYVPFVPTKEEMEAFLSAVPDLKRKAMFIIMYATGLRVSEVCTLRYGDIIKSKRRIHVAPSKRRKERFVEMPQACIDAIIQYAGTLRPEARRSLNTESWLFPKQHSLDAPIYTNFIIDYISSIEKLLGWEHRFTSHTFRRAFATHNYLDANLTMEEIQSALGHDNLSTTRLYVRAGASALQKHHHNSIEGMNL